VSAATWAGIGLLGGLGAVARVVVTAWVDDRTVPWFPFGTLAVNVVGAFALGVLVGVPVGADALRLAGAGFLGAFTTFSAWMRDTQRLGRRAGAVNIIVSLALGLAAAWLGRELGRAV
jgi:fluoride exporter